MKRKARRWLKPRVVVAIDFLEWTLDDRLRHPYFVGVSLIGAQASWARMMPKCRKRLVS